jgi:formylglycine-generating enzyme required for sulfatase activity
LAYCKWLTERYNKAPDRKFKRIIFTLPTEAEWELAARGRLPNSIFPWGTNSMRETRKGSWQGMFLANFKRGGTMVVADINGDPVFTENNINWLAESGPMINDRAFYTAPVNSFFPNNLGIYNQGGNAAEMTMQKGLTKGGSWNSFGGELRIAWHLFFHNPSPEVGFRVFMKIEE